MLTEVQDEDACEKMATSQRFGITWKSGEWKRVQMTETMASDVKTIKK